MFKVACTIQAGWAVVGLVLGGVTAYCSGTACSDGQWLGSVLGWILWGILEVPIAIAVVFTLIRALANSALSDFKPRGN
jgi:hypothetical protein